MLTYPYGPNRASYAVFCLLWLNCLPSCGGEVEGESRASSDRNLKPEDSDEEDPPLPTEAESPDGSSDPDTSKPLDECDLGFLRAKDPGRCIYQFADYCYEEKLAACACACACPSHRDSVCISGFPGPPGVPTEVFGN